ncbi:hypothetical protein [Agromyces sp. GXQ0307]|uniref:hypothetical protein n=1 Tax=Agromyces sp. GXQ0307 TaxID=3377835 RepID=UPI00383AD2B4
MCVRHRVRDQLFECTFGRSPREAQRGPAPVRVGVEPDRVRPARAAVHLQHRREQVVEAHAQLAGRQHDHIRDVTDLIEELLRVEGDGCRHVGVARAVQGRDDHEWAHAFRVEDARREAFHLVERRDAFSGALDALFRQ